MSTPLKTTIPDHNSSDLPDLGHPWPLDAHWYAPGPSLASTVFKLLGLLFMDPNARNLWPFPWTIDFIDFELFSRLELVFKNGKVHFFTNSRSHQNHLRKQQTKHPWLGSGRPKSSIRRQTRPRDMLKPKDLQWGWHISSGCF